MVPTLGHGGHQLSTQGVDVSETGLSVLGRRSLRTRAECPSPVTRNGGWDRPLPTVVLASGGRGRSRHHLQGCRCPREVAADRGGCGGGAGRGGRQGLRRDEGRWTVRVSPPKTKLDSAAPPARAAEALCPEPLRGAPVSRGSWRAAPHCPPWKRRLTGHPLGPRPAATPWDPPGHTAVSLHAPWWHVAAKAPGPSCLLAQVSSRRQIPGPESPTGRPLCLRWGLWTEAQTRTQVQTPISRIHFASE